jgi:hypothetical protein
MKCLCVPPPGENRDLLRWMHRFACANRTARMTTSLSSRTFFSRAVTGQPRVEGRLTPQQSPRWTRAYRGCERVTGRSPYRWLDLTPGSKFVPARIAEMESRTAGKRKSLSGDSAAGRFDLFLDGWQIVHEDHDQRTCACSHCASAKSPGYPAIFETGVVGTIIFKVPTKHLAIKLPCCRQVICLEFDVVNGLITVHRAPPYSVHGGSEYKHTTSVCSQLLRPCSLRMEERG